VSPRRTAFRTPTGSPQRGPLYVRLVRRTGQCFRELARRGAQSFRSLAPRGGSNFLRTETSFTSSSLCERLPADANPAHRHRRDILERSVVASCCVKECEPGHFQASFTAASRCGRVNGGPGEVEKTVEARARRRLTFQKSVIFSHNSGETSTRSDDHETVWISCEDLSAIYVTVGVGGARNRIELSQIRLLAFA
jgi:hypothetical protein